MNSSAIDKLKTALGPKGYRDLPAEMDAYSKDWRSLRTGKPGIVVLPNSTKQVAAVVNTCAEAGLTIVPQGGNTGLCGASVTDTSGTQILLNLQRMNKLREVDVEGNVVCAEAGVILHNLLERMEQENRYFPLALGAKGSCQIGGNIATNAGGFNVLRYGNIRDLVLGLEVVLPSGAILDNLSGLRKDNTGYDLKQLFIGSEGTLGIITAASLKLFPLPKEFGTVFLGLPDIERAISLFSLCGEYVGDALNAFELISARALQAARKVLGEKTVALTDAHPWYVVAEVSSAKIGSDLTTQLEHLLEAALEKNIIADGIIAHSEAQRAAIWLTRESISEGQDRSIRHDISVPISSIPKTVAALNAAVMDVTEKAELLIFGHVGDGNLHFNVVLPEDWNDNKFRQQAKAISTVVYSVIADFRGSFSAEHGVGTTKVEAFAHYKDATSQALMHDLKRLLDPANMMNPGVIFSSNS